MFPSKHVSPCFALCDPATLAEAGRPGGLSLIGEAGDGQPSIGFEMALCACPEGWERHLLDEPIDLLMYLI